MKKNPKKNLRNEVLDLKQYTAGKSIEEIAKQYNLKASSILKLGSNENILGTSKKALVAASESLKKSNLYPEVISSSLSEKIKSIFKLKNTEVVLGNGMDHIFEMITRLFLNNGDEAIICPPTFSCYKLCTIWAGGIPVEIPLLQDTFQLDVKRILKAINKKTKIIFICSPNNPTGNLMNENDIKTIIESTDKIVFLDEAYAEFSRKTLVKWVEKYPHLIVGRTFSKLYGLAGFRVGYAFVHKDLVTYYKNAITPFVVSRIGQAAAFHALDDKGFVDLSLKMVEDGKKFYYNKFSKLGVSFYPTDANFISINTYPNTAKDISIGLLKKGIIVRDCSSFGYGSEYILRITIGREKDNKRVINALRDVFLKNS